MYYDSGLVRQTGNGHWRDVLINVAGIPAEFLETSKEVACPKCGGDTRFRFIDEDMGAVRCSHCFKDRCGDAFAAVGWMLNCEFKEAVEKVALYLGVEHGSRDAQWSRQIDREQAAKAAQSGKSKNSKPPVDPAKDLEFKSWASGQVAFLVSKKPGVTEAALQEAGGKFARYKKKYSVIAFPVVGESLDTTKPVGWVIINAMGGTLPVWDREGKITGQKKVKVCYGSKPGFLNVKAVDRIKTPGLVEVAWKTEGVTDMVALLGAVPPSQQDRHVVVTNSHGAGEKPRWMASLLATVPRVHVLHDCDKPGQEGTFNWLQDISSQGGNAHNVVLPYTIEPKSGKDVRDFVAEGNTYNDVFTIAAKVAPHKPEVDESGNLVVEYPEFERILKKLEFDVMHRTSDDRVRIFSWRRRASAYIRCNRNFDHDAMIRVLGSPAVEFISGEPKDDQFSPKQIRKAISWYASISNDDEEEFGVGVWRGLDGDGTEADNLILVNNTNAARWSDIDGLTEILSPKSDGLAFDFDAGRSTRNWFDFVEMKRLTQEASDPAWCKDVIDQYLEILGRWRWSQSSDPMLIAGLTMATWIQTIWRWRPFVVVTGESGSGKSMMVEMLGGTRASRGIFGHLRFYASKASEAGLRQGIDRVAKAVLVDEFEKSRHRKEIFEWLRMTGRGGDVPRGTSSGQHQVFKINHLFWLISIESGLLKQADANRSIQLELLPATKEKANQLVLPENGVLHRLGQKLLAISIRHGLEAQSLMAHLRTYKADGIVPRTVESYAVPTAMLAKALNYSDSDAEEMMKLFLSQVEMEGQGENDQDALIDAILSATIYCGPAAGTLSVSRILELNDHPGAVERHADALEAHGLCLRFDERLDEHRLFIAHKTVAQKLLRDTDYKGTRIYDVLKRYNPQDGRKPAHRARRRFAGHNWRCVSLPWPLKLFDLDGDEDGGEKEKRDLIASI